jgi:cell division protein FtsZ
MIHFDLPKEKSSIIKVVGVGGGGSNAVNYMFSQNIEGVNFVICNTDAQAIAMSPVPNRVQLGPHLTQGLGAGANPEIGRQATEESLEEIKRILEVNTKMAFITAGMGGGTGTGGAPIIAKICKDLGILTVGIVTTPFAYEGRKRQQQAEEGIKALKQYVDTLLVISNDKLRHQFGNLKMREAFEKADNVLATAAKCITDVINSTGQINVDFADVCTVMRNGGVAILGSAAVAGEGRAHKAIEEALNSPLLNDNDIRGAKWILININSAEGEHEFTMDEVEVIQNHLLAQAGEDTDVILGLGYDNTLGDKLGITLIATGFQHKDPFYKTQPKKEEPKKEEKIVMVLDTKPLDAKKEESAKTEEKAIKPAASMEEEKVPASVSKEKAADKTSDYLAPKLVEDFIMEIPMPGAEDILEAETEEEPIVYWELNKEETKTVKAEKASNGKTTVGNLLVAEKNENIISKPQSQPAVIPASKEEKNTTTTNSPAIPVSGGYLARPSNIYAEPKTEADASMPAEEPVPDHIAANDKEETPELQMQLVERDDIPAAEKPLAHQAQTSLPTDADDPLIADEADEQKRRAVERLHKLRNLSFNVNSADPSNEFETVPAYIRRNMELYNTSHRIEEFYSSYEVKPGKDNQAQISTINTFLDGQKPD